MGGISGATIQFKRPDGTIIAQGTSDGSGNYSIPVPPDTNYTVNIIYPNDPGYAQLLDHVVVSDPGPSPNGSVVPITGVDVVVGYPTTISVYSNRTATTENQPPIASNGSLSINRADDHTVTQSLVISNFSFVDPEGDVPNSFKIIALPATGTLKYNGSACTVNQVISLTAGAFPNSFVYEPSGSTFTAYSATIQWQIKTANNTNYSNTATLTLNNSAFNSTTVYPYLSYTTTAIKTRAGIPDAAYIVDNGSTDVCWALLPSQAAGVLGSSATTWANLFALDIGTGESNKINKWANFSPVEWYLSGGVLNTRKKSVSDYRAPFAAYNHAATSPAILTKSDTMYQNVGDPGTYATVYLGEINWPAISTISKIGIRTYLGSTLLGATYYGISAPAYMTNGVMALDNNLSLPYSSVVTMTTEVAFFNSSNVKVADIPELSTFSTVYYPIATTMEFTNNATSYQSKYITVEGDSWTIVSKPDWVHLHVYSGTYEITGVSSYLNGYELRVSVDANTGISRTGTVELSDGIEITVNQQGANPTYEFIPDSPITIQDSDKLAIGAVNATSVYFYFKVLSGLGSTNVGITISLKRTGGSFIGNTISRSTRDGQYVSGYIDGLTSSDIDWGDQFQIIISTFE